MKIRFAEKSDIESLSIYDKHIRVTVLESAVSLGRVTVAEDNGTLIGGCGGICSVIICRL